MFRYKRKVTTAQDAPLPKYANARRQVRGRYPNALAVSDGMARTVIVKGNDGAERTVNVAGRTLWAIAPRAGAAETELLSGWFDSQARAWEDAANRAGHA